MINKNWTRWIHVSIHKHFSDAMAGEGIPLYIVAQPRGTRDEKTHVELRIAGPEFIQQSQIEVDVTLGVNLLISVHLNDENAHQYLNVEGQVAYHCTSLQVYRYGDPANPDNDGTLLGCLDLVGSIDTIQIGQVDKDTNLVQAMIQAEYRMCLTV